MVRYVGLDVHKRLVQACVLDDAGAVVLQHRFKLSRTTLVDFAQKHLSAQDRVVVEATTNTWAVVGVLKPLVAEVVVSNPLTTKAIATAKVKTDKIDARVLAQLLRCDFLPRVWEPDAATQELRRLSSRRSSLVADRTAIKNRLHSVLAMRLLAPPVDDLFSTKGLTWLRSCELDPEGRQLLDSDLRLLDQVQAEIAGLEKILIGKAHQDSRVKLLMTLPGVDYTVAQTVLAALGDVKRFRDGDHAASYLGLVPSTKQSAAYCVHGPITKCGNGHARWMLVQAAQHVDKHPGPLGFFCRRLAHKKNRNVAVVATARKLVVIAWHMLTKNEPYRYAQPAATETKLQRLRVRATGQKRKSGPKPGSAATAKLGAGVKSRTVKPLAQVCADEGLPPLTAPPPGEARTLAEAGTAAYVESLARPQVVAKKPRARPAQEAVPGS
jgi:transposase